VSNRTDNVPLATQDQFVCAEQNLDLARGQTAELSPYYKPIAGFEHVDRWAPRRKTPMAAPCRLLTEVDDDVELEA
jgi:hypothetical protein